MPQELPQNPESDITLKMEIETGLMECGCKLLHISQEEWVRCYAEIFNQIYNDPELKIKERFNKVYDTDPEEFYKSVQMTMCDMFVEEEKERKRGEEAVSY